MIEELSLLVGVARSALGLVKETKDMIPDGAAKEQIAKEIDRSEQALALAESATAKALGYDLCKCTFPPQIMLYDHALRSNVCPKCGNSLMSGSRLEIC